jgi:hypothetical protein
LSQNPYVILRKIDPPEKCYLSEVLLWRAFGRFPEILFDLDAKDWRFSSEALENYGAPIPDGPELTAEECRFADLPNDPRMIALDLAPNFYPALSSLRRLIMPCWACDAMAMGA